MSVSAGDTIVRKKRKKKNTCMCFTIQLLFGMCMFIFISEFNTDILVLAPETATPPNAYISKSPFTQVSYIKWCTICI